MDFWGFWGRLGVGVGRVCVSRSWPFWAGVLAVVALVVFGWRLGQPTILLFDETHYVPAARALLDFDRNTNIEHPLLAKTLIAAGIHVFGDTPLGWRMASLIMGVVCVVNVGWIAHMLTKTPLVGAVAGGLTIINFFVFIHARIAMLDMTMAGTFAAGLALFISAARTDARAVVWRLLAAGVMFGLAAGSKWAVVPQIFFCGLVLSGMLMWRYAQSQGRSVGALLFAKPGPPWPGVSLIGGGLALTIPVILVYFATFWPAFFLAENPVGPADLLAFQGEMLARQSQQLSPHPYQSEWYQWPYIGRAIWYLYEPVDGVQRGVLLVGNPVIMLGGLVAAAYCLLAGLYCAIKRETARVPALLIAGLMFIAAIGVWPVMPKKIGFYYYYLVTSLTLSIAIAVAFWDMLARVRAWGQRWAMAGLRVTMAIFGVAAVGMFVYFYPILASWPLDNTMAFLRWAWFTAWR